MQLCRCADRPPSGEELEKMHAFTAPQNRRVARRRIDRLSFA